MVKYNDFICKLKEKYPKDNFEIVEYCGSSKAGKYKCNLCKKTYNFYKMGKLLDPKREHICSHCWASSHTQEILDAFPNPNLDFVKIGYNQDLHKPTVVYKCKQCEQINEKPFNEFLKYPKCIYCGENAKARNEIGLRLLLPEEFELIGEYKNNKTKTLFRHSCGFIFKTIPKDLLSGHTYCPKCSKKASKGERKIMNFLDLKNIQFEKEKIFPWSDNKRYDFFLPKYNLLIEYNGIQHYKETNYFLSLEQQQQIDKFKKEKAIQQGYNFLVIPYTEYKNIDDLLVQRLSDMEQGIESPEYKSTVTLLDDGEDIV